MQAMSPDDDSQRCSEPPQPAGDDGDSLAPGDLGAHPIGVLSGLRRAGAAIIAHSRPLSWGAFVITCVICPVQRWHFIFRVLSPKDYVWSDSAGYVDRAWRLSQYGVGLN